MEPSIRIGMAAVGAACIVGLPQLAPAQGAAAAAVLSAEQQEADLRVIAARCGTPAFEKSFVRQSREAVKAGLIVKNREPAEVEKNITSLRRNPLVLVAGTSDCPAQLAQLAQLQKERSLTIKTGRKPAK
jgi:hypothetical protein